MYAIVVGIISFIIYQCRCFQFHLITLQLLPQYMQMRVIKRI